MFTNETTNTTATEELNKAGLIVAAPVAPVVEFEAGAEDDFLFAEDEKGNRISEADLTAKATTPTVIKFEALGYTHKAQLVFKNVSYEGRRAPTDISNRMSAEAGIERAGDNLVGAVELEAKIEKDRTYQGARVALALSAITRDKEGMLNISIPSLRNADHARLVTLITAPAAGDELDSQFARTLVRSVINEIADFFG